MNLSERQIKEMDPNVLVGIVNMQLRHDFQSLPDLVLAQDIKLDSLETIMREAGFSYHADSKRFIAD